MGGAGLQTGEPDVRVSLAPQDAQRAPGAVGIQEQGWVIGCAAQSWVLLASWTHSRQTWPWCSAEGSLGAAVYLHGSGTHCQLQKSEVSTLGLKRG